MSSTSDPMSAPAAAVGAVPIPPGPGEHWTAELHSLLRELEEVTAAIHTLPPVFSKTIDEQLVQVRLGTAASLFAALQCKNAAKAGHALRVALTCSGWALKLNFPEEHRDAVEVAALLHDVGVIGIPDHILLKTDTLDSDETEVMARARKMSLAILQRSCRMPQVLDIVESIPAWFDGSWRDMPLRGQKIPLGARMIAIVEAFDAMTTDHIYRPARSQERAIAELFECAGTQFDPELVQHFAEFCEEDQTAIRWEVAHRWLGSLDPSTSESFWGYNAPSPAHAASSVETLFQTRLLDNMYDAVVFIDGAGRVVLWNRGAERMTGVSGPSVCGQLWHPELLGLHDERGNPIGEKDCPILTAMQCGAQSLRRLTLKNRGRKSVAVDTHAIPVINETGICQGAILFFHDASSETSLERQCQSLYDKATKDPMTQVANRAEFDRVHAMFVAAHQQQRVPCSLLMCDLDRFKLINDTYGHQAGDDIIQCLASLLKNSCRPGDLVARYGGEEFVLLYADCDNAAATRRADDIRKALSQISQPKLNGRTVTVSFGVTEIQPGDNPETMLRRADRALLMAKAKGRNTVVQLGVGSEEVQVSQSEPKVSQAAQGNELLRQTLFTPVPVKVAIQKLRGFVADHQAKIVAVNGNELRLEIEDKPTSRLRRMTDRTIAFWIDLIFEEERQTSCGHRGGATRTRIKVSLSPKRNRDRRQKELALRAREILTSLRSYLMASENEPEPDGAWTRVKRLLAPWLIRK